MSRWFGTSNTKGIDIQLMTGREVVDMRGNETKEERKERLDTKWLKGLPCYTCHPKMQKLCKYYNTFSRPDYNYEQFKIGKITCDDYMEPPIQSDIFPTVNKDIFE